MKKVFTTLTLLLLLMSATAQTTFTVDGINYVTTSNNTVAVIAGGTYTGNITIPSKVVFSDVSYEVSGIGYRAFQNCTGLTSITIPSSSYLNWRKCF